MNIGCSLLDIRLALRSFVVMAVANPSHVSQLASAPSVGQLAPPPRILMGPGPSDVHPRVLQAMSTPLVGHLDPEFIKVMNEMQQMLRYVFQTQNKLTLAVSGTGSAGMEACVVNL